MLRSRAVFGITVPVIEGANTQSTYRKNVNIDTVVRSITIQNPNLLNNRNALNLPINGIAVNGVPLIRQNIERNDFLSPTPYQRNSYSMGYYSRKLAPSPVRFLLEVRAPNQLLVPAQQPGITYDPQFRQRCINQIQHATNDWV